jgi:putative transcriptional regulator
MSQPIDNSEPIKGTKMIFKLKEMRTKRDLTQFALALKINMSPTNLQRYEQGKVRSIPFEVLESFCEALDCEPGDLIVRAKNTEATTA